jgi:phosphomannomutase/phosphoglucomutase
MNEHIFREYDIRAKIGSELLIEEVYGIAQAIAFYLHEKNPALKTVAVGADGRTHSPEIKQLVCKALQDSGLDVVFVGVCPTPVVYFATFTLPVDAGLMITASHNGPEYNGIKISLGKNPVWGKELQVVKQYAVTNMHIKTEHKGAYSEINLIETYINWLHDHFKDLVGMDYKAILDCGNGAAGTVLPQLVAKMEWPNVDLLYAEVDGTYPHHEADPTVAENMEDVKKIVTTSDDYDIAMGFDGDCDRMSPMTKAGELVSGDKLLALFAREVLEANPHAAVVFDVKCSQGLVELLEQWKAKPVMSPSGHSLIKNNMKQHNALLAGELSCHFFFHDRYFGYDDGIYAMMRLFELLIKRDDSLDNLLKIFPKKFSTIELRIPCPEDRKVAVVNDVKQHFMSRSDVNVITIDGIRVTFEYGWAIVRSSNTQPAITVRFEGNSEQALEKIKREFYDVLKPHIGSILDSYITF